MLTFCVPPPDFYYIEKLRNAEAELVKLKEFIRIIRDNFDCDEDAHRYNTFCMCCEAERLLPNA
jgi:hypothetical protein